MSGPAINHKSTTPTLNDENSVTALQEREYQIWLKEFHAEQAAVEAAVEANIRATMESNARKAEAAGETTAAKDAHQKKEVLNEEWEVVENEDEEWVEVTVEDADNSK